jgi:hypothetical protein
MQKKRENWNSIAKIRDLGDKRNQEEISEGKEDDAKNINAKMLYHEKVERNICMQ